MRYLSICSGIEAASVAAAPLGWTPVAFSEIEPFPCSVLQHHYPDVPNLGDMTRYREWDEDLLAAVDIIVGGTPCQAFSVAGKRESLGDERGNLTLTFVHIIERVHAIRTSRSLLPPIVVWENVPGVLNTKDNAFGCFLAALSGEDDVIRITRWPCAGEVLGERRRVAWAVLDAQYFGVPQRRRRVWSVAVPAEIIERAGERADPATILSLGACLRGNTPARGASREGVAGSLAARTRGGGGFGTDFECDGGVIPEACFWDGGQVTQTLDAVLHKGQTMPEKNRFPAVLVPAVGTGWKRVSFAADCAGSDAETGEPGDICSICGEDYVECGCPGPTQDGMEYCEKDGVLYARPVQVLAFKPSHYTRGKDGAPAAVAAPISAEADRGDQEQVVAQVQWASGGGQVENPTAQALRSGAEHNYQFARIGMHVRRLTPTECERLQGFPDGYTDVPHRGKPAADGPRYKALGNSWAVPCARWIFERINHAEP